MWVSHYSMDENLGKFERVTDSKGPGGSAIQPGG